jgi:hypothetical protein
MPPHNCVQIKIARIELYGFPNLLHLLNRCMRSLTDRNSNIRFQRPAHSCRQLRTLHKCRHAPMKRRQFHARIISHSLRPDTERAFRHGNRDQLYPADQHIVAARIIKPGFPVSESPWQLCVQPISANTVTAASATTYTIHPESPRLTLTTYSRSNALTQIPNLPILQK